MSYSKTACPSGDSLGYRSKGFKQKSIIYSPCRSPFINGAVLLIMHQVPHSDNLYGVAEELNRFLTLFEIMSSNPKFIDD